jgi:TolA-binding protein
VPRPADPSTLAEQNDLFAAALSARRRGDLGEAVHWLDRLIARYPDGQLIESARAERKRLLEAGGEKAPSE